MIQKIAINSHEQWLDARSKDVTASTVGALFEGSGCYTTKYKLWALKTGRVSEYAQNDAMKRGIRLERAAVEYLSDLMPSAYIKYPVGWYYRDDKLGLGATPDVLVECPDRGLGVVQIKTVANATFKSKWVHGDAVIPPLWVSLQALTEAHLTGASWAAVMAFVIDDNGVINTPIIPVPIEALVIAEIRKRTREFHEFIASNELMTPDFESDGDVIRDVYRVDTGETIDLTSDNRIQELVYQRQALKETIDAGEKAQKERRVIDNEILAKIGTAQIAVVSPHISIIASTINRKGHEVAPSTFRQIKIKENVQ